MAKEPNHCTLFPDGKHGICCKRHDKAYGIGGCAEDRKAADIALRECVKEHSDGWLTPRIMYAGVRFFGSNWWPKSCKPAYLHWNCSHTKDA